MITQSESEGLRGSRKRVPKSANLSRCFQVWLVLCCILTLIGLTGKARADAITFLDGSETLTVSHTGSSSQVSWNCSLHPAGFEQCALFVSRPGEVFPPVTFWNSDQNLVTTPSGFGLVMITDPDGTPSDTLVYGGFDTQGRLNFAFHSDLEGAAPNLLQQFTGCGFPCTASNTTVIEDGSVQPAFIVHWHDGSIDTINFQSDVAPVPEPTSLFLLFSGLVSLGGAVHRRGLRALPKA